jgi:hypothetical protein
LLKGQALSYFRKMANDKQFEIEFREEFDEFTQLKQALEMSMSRAYSFLSDQCAKSLLNQIEASTDLNYLLKAIR